jgi:hypothetical protein
MADSGSLWDTGEKISAFYHDLTLCTYPLQGLKAYSINKRRSLTIHSENMMCPASGFPVKSRRSVNERKISLSG